MNIFFQKKMNRKIIGLLTIMLASVMFFTFNIEKTKAAQLTIASDINQDTRYNECKIMRGGTFLMGPVAGKTSAECQQLCDAKEKETKESSDVVIQAKNVTCYYSPKANPLGNINAPDAEIANRGIRGASNDSDCGFSILDAGSWVRCLLMTIMKFLVLLLALAESLFKIMANAEMTRNILDGDAVYTMWSFIRDLVNMFFVLILLFSAFATIFQIQQFHYKKVFFKIILAAFLVNFSFPITRVIIDVSNVMMYSLITFLFGSLKDGSIVAAFAGNADVAGVINTATYPSNSILLAAVICVFLFTVSMLACGFLFIIRMIVLMLMIVFSPAAFVAVAIPSAGRYFSSWLNTLLKYAFFGPIMMLMFYIAFAFTKLMAQNSFSTALTTAGQQLPDAGQAGFVASMATAIVPVILIWLGMGLASKMSIAGAEATMGSAKKFSKWAGRNLGGLKPLAGGAMKVSGVSGGLKQRWAHWKTTGPLGSKAREEREAWIAGKLGVPKALEQLHAKKVKDAEEKLDTANMAGGDLRTLADDTSKNQFERAAAVKELANRSQATGTDMDNMRNAFGETSQVFKQLVQKVKTYDPMAAFKHLGNAPLGPNRSSAKAEAMADFVKSNQFDVKKINTVSLGNQEFMQQVFDANAITTKDISELNKSAGKKTALDSSLLALTASNTTATDPKHKNIHMAHFAQTGEIANLAFADHIFQNMDKDTARKMKDTTVNAHLDAIARNINIGRYKEIIQNMTDANARLALNSHLGTAPNFTTGSNEQILQQTIHRDPLLSSII